MNVLGSEPLIICALNAVRYTQASGCLQCTYGLSLPPLPFSSLSLSHSDSQVHKGKIQAKEQFWMLDLFSMCTQTLQGQSHIFTLL